MLSLGNQGHDTVLETVCRCSNDLNNSIKPKLWMVTPTLLWGCKFANIEINRNCTISPTK